MIGELAERVWTAQRNGALLPAPTAGLSGFDEDAAYAVQRAVVERWVAAGQAPVGWKVGMTSAIGRTSEAPGPLYGRLMSGMLAGEPDAISVRALRNPHIEAEIAFVLDRPLEGPGVTVAGVLAGVRGVMASFEVIAGSVTGREDEPPGVLDHVVDNGGGAHVILGGVLVPAGDLDLRCLGMALRRDGELVATGSGARVLGHPAQAVAWLANALASRGARLEPGELVLSGSLADPLPVSAGATFTAELQGLGSVSARFA